MSFIELITPFNISSRNLTYLEYQKLIEKLNYERMLFQLPVIVILLIVMLMSIFGNTVVICVYRLSYRSSVANFFITLLAVVDLTTALCIPFNLQDMFHPYMNPTPLVCKIGRFLETAMAVLSGNFLVCVAFDRYFHIVYPLRRYTFQQAKYLAIVMTAIALCLSWPQIFLAGTKTVETHIEGIYGEDCSFQDAVTNSVYTLLFQGILLLSFFIGIIISVIFYSHIFIIIWRRHRRTIGERISRIQIGKSKKCHVELEMTSQTSDEITEITDISVDIVSKLVENNNKSMTTEVQNGTNENKIPELSKSNNVDTIDDDNDLHTPKKSRKGKPKHVLTVDKKVKKPTKSSSGTSRITRMMAIVSFFGLMGFLPYLIVNIFRSMGLFFKQGMGKTEDLIYEFSTKSYYLNSFVNPIIYSILNPTFRRNAWAALKKIGKICCFKRDN